MRTFSIGMLPSDSDDFNPVKTNGYCKQQAGEKVALRVLQAMEGLMEMSVCIYKRYILRKNIQYIYIYLYHIYINIYIYICKYLNLNHGCESCALMSLEGL